MKTGRIISIDSHGVIQVQLGDGVLEAQIMSGGAHIGDHVNGLMQTGIQSWTRSLNGTLIVNIPWQQMQKTQLAIVAA
jgi:hypothetical protein